tara:strand:- start:9 stop:248 length:240 start_codon:yes stop_codon:yes gene_type:complete
MMKSILTIFGDNGLAELSCRDNISIPLSELSSRQLDSERQERFSVVVVWDNSALEFRSMDDINIHRIMHDKVAIFNGDA